jgi:ubiquinone/menaquinone biosynthesis C-methylase UbiE
MGKGESVVDYDRRYQRGYMADFGYLYEAARLPAVRQTLGSRRVFPATPKIVADIACGRGRYIPVIQEAFPGCRIIGIDLSPVALGLAAKSHPQQRFAAALCESLPLTDNSVDMICSIETLEHVLEVHTTVREWARILKPGGCVLFTTPCANRFSLEWIQMYLTGGLQSTPDGIGRFRRDEPGHLRRLTSRHVKEIFDQVGLRIIYARFRSHGFTTLALKFLFGRFPHIAYWVASLDWLLLRRLPNGASMLVVGEKKDMWEHVGESAS